MMTAKSHHRCLVYFYFVGTKICTTLNKEKGIAQLRHRVTMKTMRSMNTTAGFLLIGTLKICVALNKEKGAASFRYRVTMRTIRTMI